MPKGIAKMIASRADVEYPANEKAHEKLSSSSKMENSLEAFESSERELWQIFLSPFRKNRKALAEIPEQSYASAFL